MTKIRSNEKVTPINYNDSIKKSNQFSLAKLNHGLTLNQMQLLAYFIFCTQQSGTTSFQKADLEKKFNMDEYRTEYAKADAEKLLGLKISTADLRNSKFSFKNVFGGISYDKGLFTFDWNPEFTEHILDLKEKYIINNLKMTANFKSAYSWTLYETLKAHYNHYHKAFSKDELMSVFNVENVPTYIANTGRFKKTVLDVAIHEINMHTELEVSYTETRQGKKITGFDIHWSSGKQVVTASKKLLDEINAMIEAVNLDASRIILIPDAVKKEEAITAFASINRYATLIREEENLTKEVAENAYHTILLHMTKINTILKNPAPKTVFYNWIDERE